MRPTPLFAAIAIVLVPFAAAAAPSSGVSLTGPSSAIIDGATKVPLLLTLTLQNIVCTRDVDIPVTLAATPHGARAVLATERVVFRIASQSALARTWTGDAQTHVVVAPREASGSVEIVAGYQLPSDCRALGGAASGEATHIIHVALTSADERITPTIGALETSGGGHASPPVGLQAAIAGTALAGVVVVVKRLRLRP